MLIIGGKTGATTIENDHEFSVALGALLKKNWETCQMGVEFDVNDIEGFCIQNWPILTSDVNQDGDEELLFGT
ncbi:hypothetical protein PILCRDRAFT_16824 [Piloderma croceum F 1598]|uniref:Uncharacterized protein n=1 Tax=Piloderma croceum (strain F 1598) TaxID=765440 RepID=A0A0C3EUH2_PILCF|nr:hypothetical protein PILCRDRAFT_16824 [Piloderma croceum F 1598]